MHEISASDLSSGYVGQAGKMTRDHLQKSRGGVLFIDEAYQLKPARGGSYMTEAVDELVKCLTSPEFQGKLIVVLAGYQKDMEDMLATNPGLKSRFAETLQFQDLDAKAVVELFSAKMTALKLPVSSSDTKDLLPLAERLVACGFGNGRDVETWAKMAYQELSLKAGRLRSSGHVGAGSGKAKQSTQDVKVFLSIAEVRVSLDRMLQQRAQVNGTRESQIQPFGKYPSSTFVNNTELAAKAEAQHTQPRQMKNLKSADGIAVAAPVTDASTAFLDLEQNIEEAVDKDVSSSQGLNPFQSVDSKALKLLQDFLQQQGLNTERGADSLVSLDESNAVWKGMLTRMQEELGCTLQFAQEQLASWRKAQLDVRREMEREKERQLTKGASMKAIWRCGVCGRADKPFIVCWVAPYIVRYEKVI